LGAVTRAIILGCILCACALNVGCDGRSQRRPVGYFKLGPAGELAQNAETPFSDLKLLLRHDDAGFSVMSTACTYDLSALSQVVTKEGIRWRSAFSTSEYDEHGKVLQGPAEASLPFYKLENSHDYYNGTGWALYAKVGEVVPSTWRLREGAPHDAQR
jgi:hypothetical protein